MDNNKQGCLAYGQGLLPEIAFQTLGGSFRS
jgi:hypothetical protein